jgi:hypothetical protein
LLDSTLDGAPILEGQKLANGKAAALGLGASVATDFANVYVKSLP